MILKLRQQRARRQRACLLLPSTLRMRRLFSACGIRSPQHFESRILRGGVPFMGAKIEADPQNQGVKIVFAPDSSFAYAAAQKKEVKDVLAQSFIEVTGGSVPFQLLMAQGGSSSSVGSSYQGAVNQTASTPARAHAPQAPQPQAAEVSQTAPEQVPQSAPAPVPTSAPASAATSASASPSASASTPAPVSAPASSELNLPLLSNHLPSKLNRRFQE